MYSVFQREGKVRIMDVLAALITYSMMPWEEKVRVALEAFDKDHSKSISQGELVAILECFFKGIGCMTGCQTPSYEAVKAQALEAF